LDEDGEPLAIQPSKQLLPFIMSAITEGKDPEWSLEIKQTISNKQLFLDTAYSEQVQIQVLQCFGVKEKEKGDKSDTVEEKVELLGTATLSLDSYVRGGNDFSQWVTLEISDQAWRCAAEVQLGPLLEEVVSAEAANELVEKTMAEMKFERKEQKVFIEVSLSLPVTTMADWESGNVVTVEVLGVESMPLLWTEGIEENEAFKDSFELSYSMFLSPEERREIKSTDVGVVVLDAAPVPEPPTDGADAVAAEETETREDRARIEGSFSRGSFLDAAALGRLKLSVAGDEPLVLSLLLSRTPTDAHDLYNSAKSMGTCTMDLRSFMKPGTRVLEMLIPLATMEPQAEVEEVGGARKSVAKGKPGKGASEPRTIESFESCSSAVRVRLTLRDPLFPRMKVLSVEDLLGSASQVQPLAATSPEPDSFDEVVRRIAGQIDAGAAGAAAGGDIEEEYTMLKRTGYLRRFRDMLKPTVISNITKTFYQNLPGAEKPVELSNNFANALQRNLTRRTSEIFQGPAAAATPSQGRHKFHTLADACELAGDIRASGVHHRTRLAALVGPSHDGTTLESDPTGEAQMWYEFGAFQVRQSQLAKGEMCFRRALALQEEHMPTLLSLGALLTELDRVQEAKGYLQLALLLRPDNMLVLSLLALAHEVAEEDEESWRLLDLAKNKLCEMQRDGVPASSASLLESILGTVGFTAGAQSLCSMPLYAQYWGPEPEEACPLDASAAGYARADNLWQENVELCLARFLMALRLRNSSLHLLTRCRSRVPGMMQSYAPAGSEMQLVADVTGRDQLKHVRLLLLAELSSDMGWHDSAEKLLKKATEALGEVKTASCNTGLWFQTVESHVRYQLGQEADATKALQAYVKSLDEQRAELDQATVLDALAVYRLNSILAGDTIEAAAEERRRMAWKLVSDPLHSTSPYSWVQLGAAALGEGELDMSEQALGEGSALDGSNAAVWGYISLLSLRRASEEVDGKKASKQIEEASQTFYLALKYDLSDAALLMELGNAFAETRPHQAIMAFRRAHDVSEGEAQQTIKGLLEALSSEHGAGMSQSLIIDGE
jgi:tetratricopeptide (TPR) repeat protein